jgi:hypothetical protein
MDGDLCKGFAFVEFEEEVRTSGVMEPALGTNLNVSPPVICGKSSRVEWTRVEKAQDCSAKVRGQGERSDKVSEEGVCGCR